METKELKKWLENSIKDYKIITEQVEKMAREDQKKLKALKELLKRLK